MDPVTDLDPEAFPSTNIVMRKTVAVVDLVGYSDVAKMLEENTSSTSVADLNRQIQGLIKQALDDPPEPATHQVVAQTGDGAILLFESGQAAHRFARKLHLSALQH